MDRQILRDLFAQRDRGGASCSASTRTCGDSGRATRARLAPHQIGSAGQLQEWLEDWDMQAPEHTTATSRICSASFPGTTSTSAARPNWRPPCERSLEIRGDQATGWAHRLADQPLGAAAATATTPTTS